MFDLLAQSVAPVTSSAARGGVSAAEWLNLVLGLIALVGPIVVKLLGAKNAKAAKAFAMIQEGADKYEHGEGAAQIALDLASEHSADMVALVSSAIPDKILAQTKAKPPAASSS